VSRRQALRATLGLGALAGFGVGLAALGAAPTDALRAPSRDPRALHWDRRALLGFGTTLSISAAHRDARTLERALDAAVAQLQRIEGQMSLFDAGSALSRLNRDGRLAPAPAELRELLVIAQAVAAASDGAFDVTVQPLWQAFAAAQRAGRLPTPAEVARARQQVGWQGLEIDGSALRLHRPGMAVTLNGIAQGYAADRVREVLAAHGIEHALVDAGEFAPLGHSPRGSAWTLGVADPRAEAQLLARLQADGRCVATSADNLTTFSADRRHHHIFDPRTGYSPTALSAVTVVAERGALADALTKVLFMARPAELPALAARWGVDALWVDKAGRWQATPGLALAPA